ncbi:MAG: rhomboid family intramembrane serine protease [Kiritimatiellae bacterium]|nr:rhomboid family intramembrane serine protease [Kiritimatiellia bacterium]
MDWKKIFDSVGLNGTWWQWRMIKWENRWNTWRGHIKSKQEHVTQHHKFCTYCQALLTQNEVQCPRCHKKAPSWNVQVVRRIFGLAIPGKLPVSTLILVPNFVMFLFILAMDGGRAFWSPSPETLVDWGALVPPYFFMGDYWRLITYGYLHFGIMHIGFNMFALSQVGAVLEEEIGRSRFFSLYTLSLIGGGAADLWLRGHVPIPIVGASGALFGLIGFGIGYWHFYGGSQGETNRNFFLRWALYGFVFGALIGADSIAHGGGLVTGAIIGFIVERERTLRGQVTQLWDVLAISCLVATFLSFVWMMVIRLTVLQG